MGAAAYFIAFFASFLTLPRVEQVQWIPDDGFYYLLLAGHFSELGIWSVDGGATVTSGFHPTFAYVLAALHRAVAPTDDAFITLALFVTAAFTVLAIAALGQLGRQLIARRPPIRTIFPLLFLLLATTPNLVLNGVSIMEWPLVVLTAALYAVLFLNRARSTRPKCWMLFLCLGIVGSLTRSDFIVLPGALFVAALYGRRLKRIHHRRALGPLFGLVGAVAGIGALCVHSHHFTGTLLQDSARVKHHWAQLRGTSITSSVELLGQVMGWPALTALSLLLLTRYSGHARVLRGNDSSASSDPDTFPALVGGAVMALAGYVAVYAKNGAVQPWYTATLLVPVLILCAWISSRVDTNSVNDRRWPLAIGLTAIGVLYQGAMLHPVRASSPPWPHQRFMLEAGDYLLKNQIQNVGAWNSGIIGYFAGGRVLNLDGLVNSEVYPYIVDGKLRQYLHNKNVEYVVDFVNVFEPRRARRGGYTGTLLQDLTPLHTFDPGKLAWRSLTLYAVGSPSVTRLRAAPSTR